VAALLTVEEEKIGHARIAVGGIDYAPVRLAEAEAELAGKLLDDKVLDTVGKIAAALPCQGDEVSPPEFRQHLCGVLVRRALRKAMDRVKASVNA
jgi:CO/xanthine dehydrogenase FAD-binding subunit